MLEYVRVYKEKIFNWKIIDLGMVNFYIIIIKIVVSYCLIGGYELNDYLNIVVCFLIIK